MSRKRGPKALDEWEPVLQRIFEITQLRSQHALAQVLHVDASHFSKRASAGARIPDHLLQRLGGLYRCNWQYLKTGEGPKYWTDDPIYALSPALQEVIRLLRDRPATHEILRRCAQVLATGQARARAVLHFAIQGCLHALAEGDEMRQESPDW